MRLFVAVDLPAAVKDELDAFIATLRPSLPDAKWVPRENLHLTLAFLGEVVEERVDAIVEGLRETVAHEAPIAARLDATGAFPSPRRARVFWARLEATGNRLEGLAAAVVRGLEPLGFRPERRSWTPHLTVARLRTPENLSGLPPANLPKLEFEVSEVTLFRSRLAKPAPRYEPVARVPFGG